MANINNLNTPSVPKLERRVSQVESGAPMNNAGVGRSGFEVYDNGTINVSSGNIIGAGTFSWQGSFSQSGTSVLSGSTTIAGPTGITGQLTIQGATSVTGPFTVTGVTKLDGKTDVGGAFTVTGVTKLGGDTDITGKLNVTNDTKLGGNTTVSGKLDVTGAMATKGTLSVEGVTTLKSDLNVTGAGKVKVGTMALDPTIAGGAMTFGNGSQVVTDAATIQVFKGNSVVQIDNAYARLQSGGSSASVTSTAINLTASSTFISGNLSLLNVPTTTSSANAFIGGSGVIYKVTSAARFKIDPQPVLLPDSLLDVPVKSWIDLGAAESYSELYEAPHPLTELQSLVMDDISLTRVPGIVAEEVEAAGGAAFVIYESDGTIQGVAYDRLALARTEILANQIKEIQAQLKAA